MSRKTMILGMAALLTCLHWALPAGAYKKCGVDWTWIGKQSDGKVHLGVKINTANNQGLSPSQVVSAITSALETWNGAGADFNFDYLGTTNTLPEWDGPYPDGQRVYGFGDTGGSIATTTYWYYRGTKDMVDCDCVFNQTDFNWGVGCPAAKMDLETIALHESGHFLCLSDLYGRRDADKVMYGYGWEGNCKTSLHSDDINGIKAIYGPKAGKGHGKPKAKVGGIEAQVTHLNQPHPNPFNPSTEVSFVLTEPSRASLVIYDVKGKKVRTLFEGHAVVGYNSFTWDGRDDRGEQVGSGVYFCRLEASGYTGTVKLILLK